VKIIHTVDIKVFPLFPKPRMVKTL